MLASFLMNILLFLTRYLIFLLAYSDIRHLRCIRPNRSRLITVATSIVHSKLDYCKSLYCDLPECQLKPSSTHPKFFSSCRRQSPQFMIMPKVKFSKHSIDILHVKFIFNKIAFELKAYRWRTRHTTCFYDFVTRSANLGLPLDPPVYVRHHWSALLRSLFDLTS